MKKASQWFAEYGESHQNKTNKIIHWFCVPAIFWSVVLLVWSIPQPTWMLDINWLNWSVIGLSLSMVFYLQISLSIGLGMMVFSVLIVWGTLWLESATSWQTWVIGLVIFVVAWIVQFIGHEIEGKKPSFFKDFQFLLVGPAWLMGFIYRKLGIKYS